MDVPARHREPARSGEAGEYRIDDCGMGIENFHNSSKDLENIRKNPNW
jgi:hypothetical protein